MPDTIRRAWHPDINQEVSHIASGRVGKVTAYNPAVIDEVRVEWAQPLGAVASASWLPTAHLHPYPTPEPGDVRRAQIKFDPDLGPIAGQVVDILDGPDADGMYRVELVVTAYVSDAAFREPTT